MKIISCSDLHLGNYNNFNHPTDNFNIGSRLQERLDAINDVFKYGKENKIKHYVFNGDIFDKRQKEDIRVVEYIVNSITKSFSNTPKGSTLYFNIGNHDESSRYLLPNSCELFKNINIPEHKIVIINKLVQLETLSDDTNLMFIPFTEHIKESKQKIVETLDSLNQETTVFAHLGITNSVTGRFSRIIDGEYNLSDVGFENSYVKNIVLGHYHTRQFLRGKDKSKTKSVWYQGNLLPMDFNDVEENGIGSQRGFDVIDTKTGYHKFIALTEEPYNYHTFNIIDEHTHEFLSDDEINDILLSEYVKYLVNKDSDIAKVKKDNDIQTLANDETNHNVKIMVKPHLSEIKKKIEIKDGEDVFTIMEEYCKLNKVNGMVCDKAKDILNEVLEQGDDTVGI